MIFERPLKKSRLSDEDSVNYNIFYPAQSDYKINENVRKRRSTWSRRQISENETCHISEDTNLFSDDDNTSLIDTNKVTSRIIENDNLCSSPIFNDQEELELFSPQNEEMPPPINKFELLNMNSPKSSPSINYNNCAICLSESSNVIGHLSTCSHNFCFECIFQWSKVTNLCPLCKLRFFEIQKCEFKPDGTIFRDPNVVQVEMKDLKQLDEDGNDPLEHYICRICSSGNNEHVLLICDDCDSSYHTYCVNLEEVPSGSWYCPECQEIRNSRNTNQRNGYQGLYYLLNSVATDSESELERPQRRRGGVQQTQSFRRLTNTSRRQISTRRTAAARSEPQTRRSVRSRNIETQPNTRRVQPVTRRPSRRQNVNNNPTEETAILTRSRRRQQNTSPLISLSSDISSSERDDIETVQSSTSEDEESENSSSSIYNFFCKFQRSRRRRRSSSSRLQTEPFSKEPESFEARVRRRQTARNL